MYPIIYHVKLHKFLSYNSCQTRSWRTKACSTSPPLNYLTQHVRHMYRESKKVAKGENKASTNNACLFNAIIHHHPHHVLFHYVAFLPSFVVWFIIKMLFLAIYYLSRDSIAIMLFRSHRSGLRSFGCDESQGYLGGIRISFVRRKQCRFLNQIASRFSPLFLWVVSK